LGKSVWKCQEEAQNLGWGRVLLGKYSNWRVQRYASWKSDMSYVSVRIQVN
jgi:hypothetical protein